MTITEGLARTLARVYAAAAQGDEHAGGFEAVRHLGGCAVRWP